MSKLYTVIGLMSGTSLDGVDAAILQTNGQDKVKAGATYFRPYSGTERTLLMETMQAALAWGFEGPAPNIFAQAEELINMAHKQAAMGLIEQEVLDANQIDLIGYHGQTVLHHAPSKDMRGQTLQIGSGQALADVLGIDVVYDFRSADVAAGGQGAPLAPIYHRALLEGAKLYNAAIVNVGGVSNITLHTNDGLIASDCGPGNGPLDSWVSQHTEMTYDEGGQMCLKGTPDIARLRGWMQRDFFTRSIPKSADRYEFDVLPSMHGLDLQNGAATLAMFAATGIAQTLEKTGASIDTLIICGGGRHNKAILAGIEELTKAKVMTSDNLGWDGDALEAHAFAYLAVRHIKGLPLSFPGTTGIDKPLSGGVMAKAPYSS